MLVIDDEELVLRALRRMLRDHEVVAALGGAEALAVLVDREFDIIFTDIGMPDMTGIELYRHLVTHRPADAKRVVFVTGGAITADTREFLATVPNDHIEKPVRGATLDEVIARMLAAATS